MHDVSTNAAHHHAAPQGFLRKYVFSVDHKVIGKQYYGLGLLAVLIGMGLSWLMRIHLVWPNFGIPGLQWLSSSGAPGGVITPEGSEERRVGKGWRRRRHSSRPA